MTCKKKYICTAKITIGDIVYFTSSFNIWVNESWTEKKYGRVSKIGILSGGRLIYCKGWHRDINDIDNGADSENIFSESHMPEHELTKVN